MTVSLRIDTLGILIEHGYGLHLYCESAGAGEGCRFNRAIDLEKLAAHLGRDHGCLADDLVPHLFCPACGSRHVSIRLQPPTGNTSLTHVKL